MPDTMTQSRPSTLADLRAHGWESRTIKRELQENLVTALEAGEVLFPGILGYEDTVVPEVVNGCAPARSRPQRRLTPPCDVRGVFVPHPPQETNFSTRSRWCMRRHRRRRSACLG